MIKNNPETFTKELQFGACNRSYLTTHEKSKYMSEVSKIAMEIALPVILSEYMLYCRINLNLWE